MKAMSSRNVVRCIVALAVIGCAVVAFVLFRPSTSDLPPPSPVSLPPPSGSLAPPEPAPRFIPTHPPAPPPKVSASQPVVSPPLSSAVQVLTGRSHKKADYNDYSDALRQLTADLPPNDISALTDFLKARAADQKNMRPIAFNGIKNDVLDVILRQNTLPEGIGAILVEMYRDESYDDMWRDYCVQFMTAYYEVKWPADAPSPTDGGNAEDKERETIEAVYWDALKETDTTIAGTALLGLNSLSQQYAAIDPKRVSQAAIDLLINSEVGEPARITAFSIAASLGDRQALPEARAIAQTGETITLRMAAIAAIGRLGTAKDLELLSALEQDDETRIRRIAETALKRAQRRLEHASTTAQAPQEATLNTSSLEASTD